MTTRLVDFEHRSLRAPRENNAALCEPPLGEAGALLDENVHLAARQDYDFQGRRLSDLRPPARAALLHDAWHWTSSYRDAPRPPREPQKILLAGHQPGLFHPGVWMKNFGLDWLARNHGATAVNLLIDSDTVRQTWLTVPGGSVKEPQRRQIPFDEPGERIPYEERDVHDGEMFAAAGRRVEEQIAPLVSDPLIRQYWPMAESRRRQVSRLGAALAQSRHQLEGRWGLKTLEVPQSRICSSEPFCWFVAHLMAQLPRLWEIHNRTLVEYRRLHGIRSAAHPVPDLHAEDPWLEAPFWVWQADDPRRRPVFARQRADEIVLTDGAQWQMALPLSVDADAARAVERLLEASHGGVKIRSRALVTTLWARIVLGDLFIHGIGGAKYDQLTDMLVRRFFGLVPPQFLVLSATLHLPVPHASFDAEAERRIRCDLWQMKYHPERFLDGPAAWEDSEVGRLIGEKQRWIASPQTPQNARIRCRSIRRVNQALQPYLDRVRDELLQRQAAAKNAARAEEILGSREYAACLHPERTLRELVRATLPKTA